MSYRDSVRVTGIQMNPIVGDLVGNTTKILNSIREEVPTCDVIVFPELSLTGYPPLDLVLRDSFIEEQNSCLSKIIQFTKDEEVFKDVHVVLGVVTKTEKGNGLYNSLVVIKAGEILLVHHKQLLPTYNIFDESRVFTPGPKYGEGRAPVLNIRGNSVGFFICEELWSNSDDPTYGGRDLVAEAVDSFHKRVSIFRRHLIKDIGLDLIISINASPADVLKVKQRTDAISKVVSTHNVPVFYLNQVGANDDQIYDGCSFVLVKELGPEIVKYADGFKEDKLRALFRRGKLNRSEDNGVDLWKTPNNVTPHIKFSDKYDMVSGNFTNIIGDPMSYAAFRKAYIIEMLKLGIKDYTEKCGFSKVTISLSGGIDSALVTTLAVLALGKDRVECTTMPSKYSSEGSVSDSEELCKNLGITLHTLAIGDIVEAQEEAYRKAFGEDMSDLANENLQAAIRGNAIMRRSNSNGSLVLIGSNKSEGSVGYFTMFGDSNGGLAPIGDLYKTEVWKISEYINWLAETNGTELNQEYGDITGGLIPEDIIVKPPSAELAEDQADINSLPEYPVLDAILKIYIEGDLIGKEEVGKCREIISNSGISEDEILRIVKLVDRTEYKRRMLAPVLRVHARSFGSGRMLPLAKGDNTFSNMWAFR
jgi:NAD+ synthase (glutamine-hydrolysing)